MIACTDVAGPGCGGIKTERFESFSMVIVQFTLGPNNVELVSESTPPLINPTEQLGSAVVELGGSEDAILYRTVHLNDNKGEKQILERL